MKKVFLLCLLISLLLIPLSAYDNTNFENISFNIGASFWYPIHEELSANENIFGAILFSSLYAGFGYHFPIIPNILMPGIYVELNFWLLPIVLYGLLEVEVPDSDLHIMDFGIRVYNKFIFGFISFQPFIGVNLSFIRGISTMTGFLLAFGNYGIEYSLLNIITDNYYTGSNVAHRVALVYHF